jgi:hypothetical protein
MKLSIRSSIRGPGRVGGRAIAGLTLALALVAMPAHADGCQEDVDDLRKQIKQDKEKFKKDALDEALDHLRKAEFHRLNPVECRQEIYLARKALTKGRKGSG